VAEAIERTDKRLALDLKSGRGPADLLEYFRLAADGLAMEDAAISPSSDFVRHFDEARNRTRHYFARG